MAEHAELLDPRTEEAVGSFVAVMRTLFGSLPRGEWTETAGPVVYGSGLLVPRFNGVVVLGADADEGIAAAWLNGWRAVACPTPFSAGRPPRPGRAGWRRRTR